ncbi:sensor histidine kinase [Geosporobacter ferrireducens]|uniref:sensor histidine kinase n=1 Tax=Geosporobacter ferrireducens TaxID=1424294 RepID=UPI002355D1EB|nr:sensor histidine kinase [Geosporobacter ferrireducens]
MNIYTGNQYILLFFVYGLAFYSMGICALIQNTKGESNFPLLKSIKYLGYFGISHGTTEWLLMIIIAQIYPEYEIALIQSAIILNALSFTFLYVFGIKLLEYSERVKNILKGLPWMIFLVWLAVYFIMPLFHNGDLWARQWFKSMTSRYFIGLPAGLITAIALYRNAKTMMDMGLTKMAFKLKGLALLFAVYAILAGLIVKKVDIFPAMFINKELFRQVFGVPVELGRTVAASGITILFISIIDVFQWETNRKIAMLNEQQAASRERRRLGHELHDVVLQDLFAVGLQLESMLDDDNFNSQRAHIQSMKNSLNNTILKIRDFLGKVSSRKMEIEDLKYKIHELVHNYGKTGNVGIELLYQIPDITLGHLSSEKLIQIYYIIQEAINNAIKHADATHIAVTINTTLKCVVATVKDNGKGFDKNKMSHTDGYGLFSMRERAKTINGMLEIESNQKGTMIVLSIPWEEHKDGSKEY